MSDPVASTKWYCLNLYEQTTYLTRQKLLGLLLPAHSKIVNQLDTWQSIRALHSGEEQKASSEKRV
jgi:hypothetical protein